MNPILTFYYEPEIGRVFVLNKTDNSIALRGVWKKKSKSWFKAPRFLEVFDAYDKLLYELNFIYPKNWIHFNWNESVEIIAANQIEPAVLKCTNKLKSIWETNLNNNHFECHYESIFSAEKITVNGNNFCEIVEINTLKTNLSTSENLLQDVLLLFMILRIKNRPLPMAN